MQPDIQALDRQYIAGTYRRFPAVLRHGKGSLVYDENEKEYIDLSSGIAVNTFGYADDVWQAAVTAQLGTLQHTSNLYYTDPCGQLAETLCKRTGCKKPHFTEILIKKKGTTRLSLFSRFKSGMIKYRS